MGWWKLDETKKNKTATDHRRLHGFKRISLGLLAYQNLSRFYKNARLQNGRAEDSNSRHSVSSIPQNPSKSVHSPCDLWRVLLLLSPEKKWAEPTWGSALSGQG
jgi:hypothetical protein